MRDLLNLLDNVLAEASLQPSKLRPQYLQNLIDLISNDKPVPLVGSAHAKYGEAAIFKKSVARELKQLLAQYKDTKNKSGYMDIQDFPKLITKDGTAIPLTLIDKGKEVKGVEQDYNIGDIGEIALGVAAGARFFVGGDVADFNDFVLLSNQMTVDQSFNKKGEVGNSLEMSWSSPFVHGNGKADEVTITVLAPGRSVKEFMNFMSDANALPDDIKGTILSALEYANNAQKIDAGIEKTANDPNTNMIEVVCDGISDQKGTKADLVMSIDGERVNLISAKTGPSQLGQASGHDWQKQVNFFKTVFGVDVSKYQTMWGTDNESHMKALQGIWSTLVIPKILKLTGGASVQKEKELVTSISNGLIRYSNNFNPETGQSETIDVVKLLTSPGSPGYELLRIDSKLTDALQKVDLFGEPTANGLGIQVTGSINGQPIKNVKDNLLFKARSYFSPAGNVVRTIIEGGTFLDKLATTTVKPPAPLGVVQTPVATAPVAPTPAVAPVQEPAARLTGPGAKTAKKPTQPQMTAEVLGRERRGR